MPAKQIFLTAVENYDPVDWNDYLEQSCGDDRQLRERVSELLIAHTQQNQMLDNEGVFSIQASDNLIERPGMMIGPFRILEEIGEGGFGVIFLCEQIEPIRRRVAIKVLKPGLDSRQVVARFEAERQALAMMEHPNIAHVMDAGLAPSGRPYFAMELVQGIPITEFFDKQKLSIRKRLELFIDVCAAVQHAHLKGIIHRDLKPSNILVAQADGKPVVKVIDFGIAKATGNQRLTDKTLVTNIMGFMGTPAYMSPEQVALTEADVDIRSDVYALGILLYEILTGETPIDSKALQLAGYDEMRRLIRDSEPSRPSTRVSALPQDQLSIVAANRKIENNNLRLLLKRELDWIAMKAIDKDRSRRYQSAREMADDIECFLRDAPVRACPPSSVYQLKKFIRRHQVALTTTGLVATALVVGSIFSLWQANQARQAMRMADRSLANEKQAIEKVLKSESSLKRQLYASETADGWNALNDGDREHARELLDRYKPEAEKEDHREFGWKFANSLLNTRPREFVGHESGVLTANLSPDNRWMVSGDRAGTVKVWSLEKGHEVASWNYSNKEVTTAVFSPDGKTLATAGQDSTVRLWSTDNWEERNCFRGHSRTICSVSWSPDSTKLASGARDQSVRIWDVSNGTESKCLDGMNDVVRKALWTCDGKRLVVADGTAIRSWNTSDWQPSDGHQEHSKSILALAISPDGSLLASSGYDGQVILYDRATNKLLTRAIAITAVSSLAFSPDGKYLLAGLGDGGPMVWSIDLNSNALETVRGGLERGYMARAMEFTKDQANLMVATEEDRKIRLWNSKSTFGHEFVSFPEDCLDVAVGADLAINRRSDGAMVLRSFSMGTIRGELIGHNQPVLETAISKSNKWLASYAGDNEVLLWDLLTRKLQHRSTLVDNPEPEALTLIQLEFSPDELILAAAGGLSSKTVDNSVRLWNVADGTLYRDLCFDAPHAAHIGFSPDGDRLVVGAHERIAIFSFASFGQPIDLLSTPGQVWEICYTPNGSQLVTSGGSQGTIVWDSATSGKLSQFARQRSIVRSLAISPDGQTLATAGTDHTLRLWHLPSGRELFTLLRHTQVLNWVKFASNTKLLLGTRLDDGSTQGVFVFDAGE